MMKRNGDLLTLALVSLFILGGCNNPSGIGLEVDPAEKIDVLMTDTITVDAYTVRDDSAYSSSASFTVFGLFQDPQIGETRADVAMAILRADNFRRIKPNAEIDSAILVLPYVGEFFGDTLNSQYTIQVRQLDENFNTTAASSKEWKVKNDILATKTIGRFGYKITDSLSISKHVDGKDTVIKVAPQMRIPLSNDFFKEIFSTSVDSATLANPDSFNKHIKGFYVSVSKASSNGVGGIGALAAVQGVSGIELTYRQLSDTATVDSPPDTIRSFFPINPNASGAGSMLVSAVKHHYQDVIKDQLDQPKLKFDEVYLQAPAGLRAKIVFPFLDKFKNKNILINKAELVLPVVKEAGPSYHQSSPRLTLYREDLAGRRQNIPDGATINQYGVPTDSRSFNYLTFGGWYQKDADRYSFYLTSYIQDVLQEKIKGNELYIAPASIFDQMIPTSSAINTGSRSILKAAGEGKIKLVVHYVHAKP